MNEPKWTKGKWEVVPASNDDEGFPLFYDVMRTGGFTGTIAGCYNSRQWSDGITRAESLANATLIATSPDLYAELAEIVEFLDRASFCDKDDEIATGFIISARAALSRARGEA